MSWGRSKKRSWSRKFGAKGNAIGGIRWGENTGAVQRFFVNERDSREIVENGKVRVVSLERSSRFLLYVNETVGTRTYVNNVTAACKRPKHCSSFYCDLSDFEFFGMDTALILPNDLNRTLAVGDSVT
ncbi:hypothetical protein Q1695_004164 [Nippostrongylus brasiliensis]|nr:hypothetical protein Q1695_004164 [Nippostrongylus brasiliensis]